MSPKGQNVLPNNSVSDFKENLQQFKLDDTFYLIYQLYK